MSNYTNSPDGRHDYLGVSPVSILGETPSADEGSPPGSALEADEFGGKLPRLKYGSKRMDAPETERFVCLLKEVLVKKGISQRELSRRLGIKIGTLTRYLKGDVNPYDVKLGIQRALTEELGVTMASLYAKLDGTEAPTDITVRDVTSWIKTNATPEDMATLFQSQQEAQLRHLDRLSASSKTDRDDWIPVDEARAEALSTVQNIYFERIADSKKLSKRDAWTELKAHVEVFLSEKETTVLREVVFGMENWPISALEQTILKTWPGRCQVQQAFQNWAGVGEFPNCAALPTDKIIKTMTEHLEQSIAAT